MQFLIRYAITAGLTAFSLGAHAALIDFEGLAAGTIIDTEYAMSHGVTLNGVNVARGNTPNLAVIFDTTDPTGGDSDLAAPFSSGALGSANPGNVLIIHEHPNECDGSSCSDPDDEGSRPGGYFEIDFGGIVTLNSIDFFDVEGAENGTSPANAILLFDALDNEISPDLFYVPGTGGDNTWGRLQFDLAGVSSLVLNLGGSGAIDNIDFTRPDVPPNDLPLPASSLLLLAALLGLKGVRRRG